MKLYDAHYFMFEFLINLLHTRNPIVARAWPSGSARASKGVLHANQFPCTTNFVIIIIHNHIILFLSLRDI